MVDPGTEEESCHPCFPRHGHCSSTFAPSDVVMSHAHSLENVEVGNILTRCIDASQNCEPLPLVRYDRVNNM
jgi:hypothetical protein